MADPNGGVRNALEELLLFIREQEAEGREIKVVNAKKAKGERVNPVASAKLKDRIDDLLLAADSDTGGEVAIASAVAGAGGAGVPDAPKSRATATAGEPPGDKDVEQTPIEDFFAAVANGLLSAQEQLDHRSESYLTSIAEREYLPPTVFRLPKVKGEIKFGLRDVREKGMNLLFFKTGKTHEQFQEHSLSFEVVSAPPALETVQDLRNLALGVRFRVTAASRMDLVKAIANSTIEQGSAVANKDGLLTALSATPERLIVFNHSLGPTTLLIGLYRDGTAEHLFVWHLRTVGDKPTLTCLLKSQPGDEAVRRIAPLLEEAFKRQQRVNERLPPLGPTG